MTSIFFYDDNTLVLPFAPKIEIEETYSDVEFENILGDKFLIPGKKNLKKFIIEGFITKKPLKFYNSKAPKKLSEFLEFFENARLNNKILRFILADEDTTIIDIECLCDFKYFNKDQIGDIAYQINIKEYKKVGV